MKLGIAEVVARECLVVPGPSELCLPHRLHLDFAQLGLYISWTFLSLSDSNLRSSWLGTVAGRRQA